MTATALERRRSHVGRELGDVADVRHAVGSWVREWKLPALVEDVELVASELLTNAILHAGGDIDVVVRRCGPGVRVLVRDERPDLVPVIQDPPSGWDDDELDRLARSVLEGTTTGRGLLLVDAFSDAWGVELASSSKEVWAEIGTGREKRPALSAPAVPQPAGVRVRLRGVPVRLVLLSATNMDDLIREMQTTAFESQAASELATLGEQLVQQTAPQREPLRVAARTALRQRSRRIDVELEVPPSQIDVLRRFVSLTDQVMRYCQDGVLLSEPPGEELTAFRSWYVDELDRQVRGEPPRRCPFTD